MNRIFAQRQTNPTGSQLSSRISIASMAVRIGDQATISLWLLNAAQQNIGIRR